MAAINGSRYRAARRGAAGAVILAASLITQPFASASAGTGAVVVPPGPAGPVGAALPVRHMAPASQLCGTRARPQTEPQALQDIHASQLPALGIDGAGVTVAVLADGLNPANADLVRNGAYGPAGTPVVTGYQDYSEDGTAAKTDGSEAFGDASSIAAQGNKAYNLSQYVNPHLAADLPPGGCWVRILGAAPGASLLVLKVTANNNQSTVSGIVQAVRYAVQHNAKVINESFGSGPFPDSALDALRDADDDAVAAGVTVVVSTGDGGVTSTIGSPASDPNVISVGASTNFRLYAQADLGGFYNPVVGNGRWANDNISSLSSAGFNQSGGTVDLVAPGDLNWALCSTDTRAYTGCADDLGGTDIGVQEFGGTSEAAPLTAAAAADVIQAYALAHGGADPTPALVKQILLSTATDIGAPAAQQGAGLLNVAGAVKLAQALPSAGVNPPGAGPTTTTTAADGAPSEVGVLISPNQINVVGGTGATTPERVTLTDPGPAPVTVRLATRALTKRVYDTGPRRFVLDPGVPTTNTGTFPIWSGVTEVYQPETFEVPAGTGTRLIFSADYQDTGQTSDLHFALFEPDGTYAGYSEPQGLGDYAEAEVANPPAGLWTALFFTAENGARKGVEGTTGEVQWDASTWQYESGTAPDPALLTIAPGQTATAVVAVTNPPLAGDTDESVVVSYPGGQSTVPVTVRTTVSMGVDGGSFKGVLTGGNGRDGSEAQTNTYFFQVPPGERDLEASVDLSTDPAESLVGYLIAPGGEAVGYSSNYTFVPSGSSFEPAAQSQLVPEPTPYLQLYTVAPEAGTWQLVLEWQNPVTGNELTEPFSGAVQFDQVRVSAPGLPASPSTTLVQGRAYHFRVDLQNTGVAPEGYFVDPRLDHTTTEPLKNINPAAHAGHLRVPVGSGSLPLYLVPTGTTQLDATVSRLSGTGSVSFDLSPLTGDPDVSPGVSAAGVTASSTSTSYRLDFEAPALSPGVWGIDPGEVGPYPAGGAPRETVASNVSAVTAAFDRAVRSDTDDLWEVGFKFSRFHYLEPDQSVAIPVTFKPTGAVGSHVSGALYIDDFTLDSFVSTQDLMPDADEVAEVPYSYTVAGP